jgi:hypothetical protein
MHEQINSNHEFIASKITNKLRYISQPMKEAVFRRDNTEIYKKKGRDVRKYAFSLQM